MSIVTRGFGKTNGLLSSAGFGIIIPEFVERAVGVIFTAFPRAWATSPSRTWARTVTRSFLFTTTRDRVRSVAAVSRSFLATSYRSFMVWLKRTFTSNGE